MIPRIPKALLLILLLCCEAAHAHNGAVAIAFPATGITIDGDFSDWPAGVQWHPVARTSSALPPRDAIDFTASFAIAYSSEKNALYLALDVHDESVVVQKGSENNPHVLWNTQDGCEIYVDLLHRDAESSVYQYGFYGEHLTVISDQRDILSGEVAAGYAEVQANRTMGRHRYEWKIDAGKLDERQNRLPSGMSISVDLAVCDKDEDGSFSWIAWGEYNSKYLSAERRGDVLLLEPGTQLGEIHGKLEGASQTPLLGRIIDIRSSTSPALRLAVKTDPQGVFAASLPVGVYKAETSRGQGEMASYQVEVDTHSQTALSIILPPPSGHSVEAGKGRRVRAGSGIWYGQWHSFGPEDGMPHGTVLTIVQDRRGDLWFGTIGNGACRYDGRYFTTFTSEDGLAGDDVRAILEDRHGNIWFGTYDGVSRYDGRYFTTFTSEDGLTENEVEKIIEDREGNIWFSATSGDISRYDGRYFTTFPIDNSSTGNGAILEDSKGNIWFGMVWGGVRRYDGKQFTSFTTEDGLWDNRVENILEDRHGNIWFGTARGSVSCYDGEEITNFHGVDGLPEQWVMAMAEDRTGNIWFGLEKEGVSRFDGRKFENFTVRDGLAGYGVMSILEDREGNLWFGSHGNGVSRYNGQGFTSFTLQDHLQGSELMTTLEDRKGNIWFATDAGVHRYDGKTFTRYTTEDGLAYDRVITIFQDRRGDLWFGTYRAGISRFDGKTFTNFDTDDGLAFNRLSTITEDSQGDLWFGTSGGGVSRFDGRSFTNFTTEDGLPSNFIYVIREDDAGNIWFATGLGVSRYDGRQDIGETFTNFTTEDGLPDNRVGIFTDQEGHLCFTAGTQFSRFDGTSFHPSPLTTDALDSSAEYLLFQDREGHLWFKGHDGIIRYDGVVSQKLLRRDGLNSSNVHRVIQDNRGDFWLMSNTGATRYQPTHSPPPIHITDIVADKRYGSVDEIRLASSQTFLAFEFNGRSFKTRPEAMVYRYRLKGYDEDWRTTRQPRAEYQNLPTDYYTFEVIAVDRDLTYSEQPATVRVHIHLPYERIAWIASLVLALGLIAWQAGRVYSRDLKLQIVNNDLSTANYQLQGKSRQLEKANREVQQATEAKSAFLASMSHELRTPMNSIINFSSLILEDIYGDIPDDLRDAVEEIDTNSDRLLQLINDILDLSKVEAGSLELQLSDCIPEACIDTAAAALEHQAADKELTIIREVEPDLPILQADERRLTQQVLINLLGNAVKFTERGEIRVGARREDGHVLFWVSDTGIGIPEEERELIFETFHQVGSSLTHQVEGTGLGLAIAHQFVELHGGRIRVESEVGRGSIFFFTVPVHG
ncbi:MAG: hypothetical protein HOC74_14195 [Gemmatimonadetes bacterium]|mgnify:CR=1 FL=1|jgi:signal transduction histidine kinase/ligand-binding sensor domain-containing protein|nr:hypothetical protein [Gemmatimonadota bacterium]